MEKNYDFGIIGNCISAALISSDCSIDWACLPFFDSPSVFAKLLDNEKGGHFKISAVDVESVEQKYVKHTAILKTTFRTKHGTFEVNDYMPRFFIVSGKCYCPSEIQRNIVVLSGKPKIIISLKAMPNYAASEARYTVNADHIKITSLSGDYNSFFLYSNLDFNKILSGEPIDLLDLSFLLFSYHEKLDEINIDKIYVEYERTKSFWLDWAQTTKTPKQKRDEIIRSAITLKLLTFQKTGAVVAAPTTSLPEIIGENRNWDYRFCWTRDASMMIDLYSRIGHTKTAERFLNFILSRLPRKAENIRVMYSIAGDRELVEKSLDHLSGYEGSKPVRIGNQAYVQNQNDLYGELIEAIYTYFIISKESRGQQTEELWTMVRTLVKYVIDNWEKPDSGIWERRTALQHYVHSKMMNWVAMDRAAKVAKFLGKNIYVEQWSKLAEDIKKDILANGWNENLGSFTMFYGSDVYDASNLLMLHYGFLPRDDKRMKSTVLKSYEYLVKDGMAFRYISEDEFGQPKNAFIVTTFWMINALYLIGEKQKAWEMLSNIVSKSNKLGLFSEAIELTTGRLTGNFPQGYSHLAHIQTLLLFETEYNWTDIIKVKDWGSF